MFSRGCISRGPITPGMATSRDIQLREILGDKTPVSTAGGGIISGSTAVDEVGSVWVDETGNTMVAE